MHGKQVYISAPISYSSISGLIRDVMGSTIFVYVSIGLLSLSALPVIILWMYDEKPRLECQFSYTHNSENKLRSVSNCKEDQTLFQ